MTANRSESTNPRQPRTEGGGGVAWPLFEVMNMLSVVGLAVLPLLLLSLLAAQSVDEDSPPDSQGDAARYEIVEEDDSLAQPPANQKTTTSGISLIPTHTIVRIPGEVSDSLEVRIELPRELLGKRIRLITLQASETNE